MELTELQKHWEEFGKTDPLWAILSQPDKKQGRWDPAEFFRSGLVEIDDTLRYLKKLGRTPQRGKALDFGCGVGRLTQSLCRHFERCVGIDIAQSMIEQARRFNAFGERCEYFVNPADDLRLFPDNSFDLVYSNIVLQHMEPRYSESYIGEFIRVLKPGGMTYFQLPAEPDEAGTAECPAVPLSAFAGKLSWVSFPSSLRAGQPSNVRVRVQNTGALAWPGRGKMRVKAGNHWRAADGAVIAWDDGRKDLPGDLPKGAECVVDVRVVPPAAGRLILEMDLVQEHVAWFSSQGCETLRRGFLVKPAAPAAAPRAEFEPTMELYGVPVDRVKHLLDAAGATLLDAQEDGWAGPDWLSYHYVAIKR